MEEIVVTAEAFYAKLKRILKRHQVLYVTRSVGRNTGGREATFSGWEKDGELRFHFPDSANPNGCMRYIKEEDIKAVYAAWEPGKDRKLGQQIAKICDYRDVRKSVLIELIKAYG